MMKNTTNEINDALIAVIMDKPITGATTKQIIIDALKLKLKTEYPNEYGVKPSLIYGGGFKTATGIEEKGLIAAIQAEEAKLAALMATQDADVATAFAKLKAEKAAAEAESNAEYFHRRMAEIDALRKAGAVYGCTGSHVGPTPTCSGPCDNVNHIAADHSYTRGDKNTHERGGVWKPE